MPIELELARYLKRKIPFNRRTYFRDLAEFRPHSRASRSPVIQFYSSQRNIGNYIAVQGIHQMLGYETDVWDMHRVPVDWDYINANYKFAIIGGAGLLHSCFDQFWAECATRCKLPYSIWGVGVCLPENELEEGVNPEHAKTVFRNARSVNVRDSLTSKMYGSDQDHISICPSVCLIKGQIRSGMYEVTKSFDVLHSIHTTLTEEDNNDKINRVLIDAGLKIRCTENTQSRRRSIVDVLALYPRSKRVVTSRLHGAIIAFAFDIPYVAFSYDPKVKAFVDHYGGGLLCDDPQKLPELLESGALKDVSLDTEAENKSLAFGETMKDLIDSL